jgi:hypothetical protein
MTGPRYPDVSVRLVGQDGNAFYVLGAVRRALQAAGVPAADVETFTREATTGRTDGLTGYEHLLVTVLRWVDVT